MENINSHPFVSNSCASIDSLGDEPKKIIVNDRKDPNFYKIFSNKHQSLAQEIALENFKKWTPGERALQKLDVESCDDFTKVVMDSMREVLSSGDSEGTGEVFIHLLKLFNSIGIDSFQQEPLKNTFGTRISDRERLVIKLYHLIKSLNDNKLFQGLDLSGLDLSQLLLNDKNLAGLTLDLSHTNFMGTKLIFTDLSDTMLNDTVFANAEMNYTVLNNASMLRADLTNAELTYAQLVNANLNGSILKLANLSDANLSITNLTDADLDRANFYCTVMIGTIMTGVKNYSPARLEGELDAKVEIKRGIDILKADAQNYPLERQGKTKNPACCIIS